MEELIRRFDKLNMFLQQKEAKTGYIPKQISDRLFTISGKMDKIVSAVNNLTSSMTTNIGSRRQTATQNTTTPNSNSGSMRTVVQQLTFSINNLNASIVNMTNMMQTQNPQVQQHQQNQQNIQSNSNLKKILMAAIGYPITELARGFLLFRQTGFSPSQSINQVVSTVKNIPKQFLDAFTLTGTYTSPVAEFNIRRTAARHLQNLTPDRLESISSLYGKTRDAETSVQLQRVLERFAGYSPTGAGQFSEQVKMRAGSNQAAGVILRQMAENGDLFANAMNRSAAAMTDLVDKSQKLNVSIKSVEGFANSMTGDFENFLEAQSQLQVLMPGVDLTGAVLAAQYGSDDDVLTELMKTFGGTDIGQLPRSMRQLISNAVGIPVAELVSMGRGIRREDQITPAEPENKFLNGVLDFGTSVVKFGLAVGGFAAAAALLSGSTLVNTLRGGAGGVAGGAAAGAAGRSGFLKFLSGAGRAAPLVGVGIQGIMAGREEYEYGRLHNDPHARRNSQIVTGTTLGAGALGTTLGTAGALALGAVSWPALLAAAGIGGLVLGFGGKKLSQKFTREGWADTAFGTGSEPIKRYHSGGVIHPNEVPAILQKGEAVLTQTQLGGLTKLIQSVSDLGEIGDTVSREMSGISLSKFSRTFEKFSGMLFGDSGIVSTIGNVSNTGLSGLSGLGSSIMGSVSNFGSNILSKITGGLGNLGETGIGKAISGLFSGGLGNVTKSIGNIFSGGLGNITGAISGIAGGSLGDITKSVGGFFSGGITKAIGGLLGGSGVTNTIGGLLGGGASSLLGGIAGGPLGMLAMPLLNKIPGIGSITSFASNAVGKVTGAIGNFVGGIFGGRSKDPNRLKANERMFQRAMGGDMEALAYLKQRSGQFGEAMVGGENIGGWGSDKAKNDAYEKFIQASSSLGGMMGSPQAFGNFGMMATMTQGVQNVGDMANSRQQTVYSSSSGSSNNNDVVSRLDELIRLLRGGAINVNMDGRKVGDHLAQTFSRGA